MASGNHRGIRVGLSLETASAAFDIASWTLVAALVVGAVATIVIVFTGIVKEHHWDALREQSKERIVGLEAETAKANAEAGKAHADIAKANVAIAQADARAAEANQKAEAERVERLKLEVKLAPRSLGPVKIELLAKQLESLAGVDVAIVAYEGLGHDVVPLSNEIAEALIKAKATAAVFTPFGGSGYVRGILVRTVVGASADIDAAAATLIRALNNVGLDTGRWEAFPQDEPIAGAYNGPQGATPSKTLRVLVGAKP
jgi:hypothetical protein